MLRRRSSWLEIWRQTPTGLILDTHKRIQLHGRITMLQSVSFGPSKRSHLFVSTANRQYFTLSWNLDTDKLETQQTFEDVTEPSMRDSQTLQRCIVDPTGTFYALMLYEGCVSLMRQKRGKRLDWSLDAPEQIRITELDVKASAFMYSQDQYPRMAILHQSGRERKLELNIYQVWDGKSYSSFEKTQREHTLAIKDGGSTQVIPVPHGEEAGVKRRHVSRTYSDSSARKKPALGGVIVVGETMLQYYDPESKSSEIYALKEASMFVSWTALDDLRFLLADEYGGLHLLTIIADGNKISNMEVIKMGQVSQPTAMIPLGNDMLFIGSHIGDQQLWKLNCPTNKVPYIELLQELDNMGPVLDFSIMDLGHPGVEVGATTKTQEFSSGQARIVAGCGVYESGSLQSIRSGVGLDDFGMIGEMDNVKGIFALHVEKLNVASSIVDDTLVISSKAGTRVFRIYKDGVLEELAEFMNFPMDEETLLAKNIGAGILHVSPTTVRIIDPDGMVMSMWGDDDNRKAKDRITSVSANESTVLLCFGGSHLVALDLKNDLASRPMHFEDGEQVACIHIPSIPRAPVAFVGFWNRDYVSIISLMKLKTISSTPLNSTDPAAIPRELLMAHLLPKETSNPTLLVSMSDGVIISLPVQLTGSIYSVNWSLGPPSSIALGTQQASLKLIPSDNPEIETVFATCELSTLIHAPGGRVTYSSVDAQGAVVVAPLNAVYYPRSVVIASDKEVKISVLDGEKGTHVRKLPLGETVRRLAYCSSKRVFGVGAIKRQIKDGMEEVGSEFRVVDEIAWKVIGKPLKLGYKGNAEMVESVIVTQFDVAYGEPQERFVVGTSFLEPAEDRSGGRLLVIGLDRKKSPYLIAQHTLKGSCNRLGIVDGKIVAALTKQTTLWEYEETSKTAGELKMVTSLRAPSTPIDLAVNGNSIAITDLMKSVSILEYKRGEKGLPSTLTEVARDWDNRWGTAVGHLEGNTYVGADGTGNLKVLKHNPRKEVLPYEQEVVDNNKLENVGEYHLGENVTAIKSFQVKAAENAVVIPRASLSTVRLHSPLRF